MESNKSFPQGEVLRQISAELMDLCEQLCLLAREHVISHKPPKVVVMETKSTPVDVVTAMDKEVEKLLRDYLSGSRPDDGFFGEESDATAGVSGYTWVIDPIDGTVNYLYGLENHAVSIGVVWGPPDPKQWVPIAGAVVRIPDGKLWKAGRGQGAWQAQRRLNVNAPQDLETCLVATGFGYSGELRKAQAEVLVSVLPRVRDIRRVGSAALELCYLAEGGVDLFYERGLNPWDTAAAGLIVREAGGIVTGLRGEPEGDRMTVAGDPARVQELVGILCDTNADANL